MPTTVLIVDDSRTVRRYCKTELEAAGFRVFVAQDGHEAFDLLGTILPNVVVLDVHLQQQNGLEVAKHLRDQFPGLPLIFHTSSCISARATECIRKSADIQPLIEAIVRSTHSNQANSKSHSASG